MDAKSKRVNNQRPVPPIAAHQLAAAVLEWYDAHARSLPWRAPPGASAMDAYRVWLSEIMLQQTTVAAVLPYFEKFTRKWPDIDALAAADEAEVLAAWAGLGYYSRARNMVKTARIVSAMGGFPTDEAALRALPGLGPYTAAAIAAIAFDQRAVVVDANIERVVARICAIATPLPTGKTEIYRQADMLTPDRRAGDYAQALMDIGASICTAKKALCSLCPLAHACKACAAGDMLAYPVKAPKKARPVRHGAAFWVKSGSKVLLVRRPEQGMLAGMRALPDDNWRAKSDGDGIPPFAADWRNCGTVRHVFSHFALELTVYCVIADTQIPFSTGEWWPLGQIAEAGLPSLFAKAAQLAIAQADI